MTWDSEGFKQLNYPVLCHNMLENIQDPLESGARQTSVVKPYHIVCQSKDYSIQTVTQTKKYQLVFGKHVVDPETFMTYPYEY